ncbi:MAG: PD40 domain-containing protein [Acidobacteria bacterium]|nr:PD40 domain-containing protein [Acidobacteriota bacterium]
MSADGRWVAFDSQAYNLVPGDTNGWRDVFIRDQQQGTTTLVSLGAGGVQGNGHSYFPAISPDGRWVVVHSSASNLVPGDTNGLPDVFVRDLQQGTTTRVNVGPGGAQADGLSGSHGISADGRWVVFDSEARNLVANDTNQFDDVFLHDLQTATTTRLSVGPGGVQGNGRSSDPVISADGRWVAFGSYASNLVAGDPNGNYPDVFIQDQQTGTTTRVAAGAGPAISPDGRWVAFVSAASDLVPGDTNDRSDVFVHDRQQGTTTRVSLGTGGVQANDHSGNTVISANGRWVAFESMASNLVVGDTNGGADAFFGTDVFVHDLQAGVTLRVSVGPGGTQGDGRSYAPSISANGRWVAFESSARNLVPDDTNNLWDVFVHDRVDPNCAVTLAPTSALAPPAGATQTVQVSVGGGCGWTAASNDPWLTVTGGSSGTGSGTVTYGVTVNPGAPRTGSLSIWGQLFPVHQASATIPEPPTDLVASSIVGNRVTLRWTMPPGGPAPTNFVLEGGVYPGQVLASVPTGTSAPAFTFVAPTGSFYVRMHALNGPYRSEASNEVRIYVNVPVAPSAPANLLGLVNGSTLALAWTNTYEGGAPMSLYLNVSGAIYTSVPLGMTESFAFAGVPPGTYEFEVLALNAAGGATSNRVTLTFPGPCSGAPDPPAAVVAYAEGRTVFVDWRPAATGTVPTSYVLHVTGAYVGAFATATRGLSGTVGPGAYTVSVVAVNACGPSAASPPQTVVVP